jgi:diguanylate cyclase (GGDEF)-like protein
VAANEELKALSETDTLTAVANRRRFDRTFDGEFKRCQRSESPLSVLFIDIDKFKSFNDTYGHGDECIRRVAQALASRLKRPADLVARYGGEEFAVLLPQTAAINAEVVAGTMRKAVANLATPIRVAHTAASRSASALPAASATREPARRRCWRPPTVPCTLPRSRGKTASPSQPKAKPDVGPACGLVTDAWGPERFRCTLSPTLVRRENDEARSRSRRPSKPDAAQGLHEQTVLSAANRVGSRPRLSCARSPIA